MKSHFRKFLFPILLVLLVTAIFTSGAMAEGKMKSLKILTPANTPVKVGETFRLETQIKPEDPSDPTITWTSADETIATVDENGVVTAKAPGKVKITATANDGSKKKATVSLTVPSLVCDTSEITLDQPDGATFTVEYFGDDWDKNVTVSVTGKCFEYWMERDGNRVSFWAGSLGKGKGKLTIKDKQNPKSIVTVNLTADPNGIGLSSLFTFSVQVKDGMKYYTIKNNGTKTIKEVHLTHKFYNKDDVLLFTSSASPDGINEEELRNNTFKSVNPGATEKWRSPLTTIYPEAVRVEAAVVYLVMEDDTVIWFPEDGYRWYSSSEKRYINLPAARNTNCFPDAETLEKWKTVVYLGMKTKSHDSWVMKHYGYHNAGEEIVSVEEGSIAEKAGLQVYDLIVTANGVSFPEDTYTLVKAIAAMADTGTLTLTVERYGQEGTFEVVLTR